MEICAATDWKKLNFWRGGDEIKHVNSLGNMI
jgi:hypothetical protein